MAAPERRRRRVRRGSTAPAGAPEPGQDGTADPAPQVKPAPEPRRTPRAAPEPVHRGEPAAPARRRPAAGAAPSGPAEREAERGLRGLVGSGSSQLTLAAAMRARDAARPTEADLAAAEKAVVIVRRNWVPREELPGR